MGTSDSKEIKIGVLCKLQTPPEIMCKLPISGESSRLEQLMVHVYLDDIRKSIIKFETYCGNVGKSKKAIYDTNGIQIIKPLTNHEVK